MKQLNDNWLTEGTLDFEYKKYVLLDFLQQTDKAFQQIKLYPALSELMRHYSSLKTLKALQTDVSESFPKRIIGFDPANLKLQQVQDIKNNPLLDEVMEIVEYALPVFSERILDGQEIYNFVEGQIKMEPIGIEPLNMDEGYLLLHDVKGQDVLIYRYGLSIFENSNERFRALKTEILCREKKTIGKSFEQIKLGLIKRFQEIPNPSTWLISSELNLPLVETFLPISKRLMMQKLHMRA